MSKEFHYDDYIVHSPQAIGTFSDENYVDSAPVDDLDEEEFIDLDEYFDNLESRKIPVTINHHLSVEIDPLYEEKYVEMSDTDKQIIQGLSKHWVQKGVIEKLDGHNVVTSDSAHEIISSAQEAAQKDYEINPEYSSHEIERIDVESHLSEEAGVNPFAEDAEYLEDNVDAESMIYPEDAEEGMKKVLETADEKFADSQIDFVDASKYSSGVDEYTVNSEKDYENIEAVYSGKTRRLATSLDVGEVVEEVDETTEEETIELHVPEQGVDNSNTSVPLSDTLLVLKLLNKGLSNEDISDVIDSVSAIDVEHIRKTK